MATANPTPETIVSSLATYAYRMQELTPECDAAFRRYVRGFNNYYDILHLSDLDQQISKKTQMIEAGQDMYAGWRDTVKLLGYQPAAGLFWLWVSTLPESKRPTLDPDGQPRPAPKVEPNPVQRLIGNRVSLSAMKVGDVVRQRLDDSDHAAFSDLIVSKVGVKDITFCRPYGKVCKDWGTPYTALETFTVSKDQQIDYILISTGRFC